jgi:hypothetical protein
VHYAYVVKARYAFVLSKELSWALQLQLVAFWCFGRHISGSTVVNKGPLTPLVVHAMPNVLY